MSVTIGVCGLKPPATRHHKDEGGGGGGGSLETEHPSEPSFHQRNIGDRHRLRQVACSRKARATCILSGSAETCLVVSSIIFSAVVCRQKAADANRLSQIVRLVLSWEKNRSGERGVLRKLLSVTDYASHPQHDTLQSYWSTFSSRMRKKIIDAGKTLSSIFYCLYCMNLDINDWCMYV